MIRFALHCSQDHAFEAWFRSGEAFERQVDEGQVACPACGDRAVRKAVMAPAVVRSKGSRAESAPKPEAKLEDPRARAMLLAALARKLREHVEKNFEDVGERFPEEVRRMHHGEAEARDVYGRATLSEAKELLEEGIPVCPLPEVPKLDN